jgi:phospholipid-binding lipoprotein MlaA
MKQDQIAAADSNEVDSSELAIEADPRDPIESINRPVFDFNWKVLDEYVLRPVAVGYGEYVPTPVRTGLLNIALNLEEPANLANNLLQLKVKDAGISTGRFLINSTLGLFGMFDVAEEIGLKRQEEDFGQTLGVWGVDHGAYLMLPGYGPSTAKDLTGDVVDATTFALGFLSLPQSLLKTTIKLLDTRVDLISQEQLLNDSVDPYLFTKELYFQRQEYKLYDGNVPESEDDFSEFDDEDFDDEDMDDEDMDDEDI